MLKFHHLATNKKAGNTDSSFDDENIEASVKAKLADLLCMNADSIDVTQPMINYGVDSLVAIELVDWANSRLGVTLDQLDILEGLTTAALLEKAQGA